MFALLSFPGWTGAEHGLNFSIICYDATNFVGILGSNARSSYAPCCDFGVIITSLPSILATEEQIVRSFDDPFSFTIIII